MRLDSYKTCWKQTPLSSGWLNGCPNPTAFFWVATGPEGPEGAHLMYACAEHGAGPEPWELKSGWTLRPVSEEEAVAWEVLNS